MREAFFEARREELRREVMLNESTEAFGNPMAGNALSMHMPSEGNWLGLKHIAWVERT